AGYPLQEGSPSWSSAFRFTLLINTPVLNNRFSAKQAESLGVHGLHLVTFPSGAASLDPLMPSGSPMRSTFHGPKPGRHFRKEDRRSLLFRPSLLFGMA